MDREAEGGYEGRRMALKVERGTPLGAVPHSIGSNLLPYRFGTSTAWCVVQYIYCLLHSSVHLLLSAFISTSLLLLSDFTTTA